MQVGDGLDVGDETAVGFGVGLGEDEGEGEAFGVELVDVAGVGVAGGLAPLGPGAPHATTRNETANKPATRTREVSHRGSRGHRVERHAVGPTFDPSRFQTPGMARWICSRSWCWSCAESKDADSRPEINRLRPGGSSFSNSSRASLGPAR